MQHLLLLLALLGAVTPVAGTFPVKVKVEDSGGAAVKDELVIVQDLNNREHEILRALSDQGGNVPTFQVPTGVYRVIATAPYGLWKTSVREFLVSQQSTQVIVRVEPTPTHGYGDIVTIGTTSVQLQVIGPDGEPANGARILIRDGDATLHLERWYETSGKGMATIELVGKPTVAVVIYGDMLLTTELADTIPALSFACRNTSQFLP
jgi:hypothetical protein